MGITFHVESFTFFQWNKIDQGIAPAFVIECRYQVSWVQILKYLGYKTSNILDIVWRSLLSCTGAKCLTRSWMLWRLRLCKRRLFTPENPTRWILHVRIFFSLQPTDGKWANLVWWQILEMFLIRRPLRNTGLMFSWDGEIMTRMILSDIHGPSSWITPLTTCQSIPRQQVIIYFYFPFSCKALKLNSSDVSDQILQMSAALYVIGSTILRSWHDPREK